jgi:hypothetical protein
MEEQASSVVHIELDGLDPPIWRSFIVPCDISFADLHLVLRMVMGWTGSHGHGFWQCASQPGRFLAAQRCHGRPIEDEYGTELCEILTRPSQSLTYEHDSTHGWMHTVTLLALLPGACRMPQVLAGERACPPEDCGGPNGYATIRDLLAEPAMGDPHACLHWLHPPLIDELDRDVFPLQAVNQALARGIHGLFQDAILTRGLSPISSWTGLDAGDVAGR